MRCIGTVLTAVLLCATLLPHGECSVLKTAFLKRSIDYLNSTALSASDGMWADIARLRQNISFVRGTDFQRSMVNMYKRVDCSDFAAAAMLRLLTCYNNSALLTPTLRDEIKQALVSWQFWIDEANGRQGNMQFWTENHQMNFHTAEYLTGHLFPNELFPGTNMTGQQHYERGRQFVHDWMLRRYLWGWSEWKSETYYQFDIVNLSTLVNIAPDADIAIRATMCLDLILFDISIHAHRGMICSSRGRSYGSSKFNISNQSVASVVQLVSGLEGYTSLADNAAVSLVIAVLDGKYDIPEVVLGVAVDRPEELENREHVGIDPADSQLAAQGKLGYTDPEDGIVWWGMEAYVHPKTINLAFKMGDAWNLYDSNETVWHYFKFLREADKAGILPALAEELQPLTTSVLGPVSSYIYRTPDVSMAAALDFRPGTIGFQQHSWQATLSGTALVFTTAPGPNVDPTPTLKTKEDYLVKAVTMLHQQRNPALALGDENDSDYADGLWTGSSSLPRVGQYKDVLVSIYRPPWKGEPFPLFPERTHAYFPQAQFDQVVDQVTISGWVMGSKGNGYVALYTSSKKVHWNNNGTFLNRELIAEGQRAEWICVIGRSATYGTFENFTSSVLSAKITIDAEQRVAIEWPSNGRRVTFGWTEPLIVQESTQAQPFNVLLSGFGRFQNPYVQSNFPADELKFSYQSYSLTMDFNAGTRVVAG